MHGLSLTRFYLIFFDRLTLAAFSGFEIFTIRFSPSHRLFEIPYKNILQKKWRTEISE